MIFRMSKWNISGDALTIEQTGRRSPSQWLRQNGLRIAVMAGLAEAVLAWVTGHRVLLLMIGVLSAIVYLNVRHRLPELIRRPLWIVVMAQAIGGLIAPLIYLGVAMFVIVAGMLLVILALVMLGDRMRK
jgi:hypothetical protein